MAGPEVLAPSARQRALSHIRAALRPTFLPNHFPPLHGLRVIAVLMVIDLHATSGLFILRIMPLPNLVFWFAMDLFFFLSGFLIGFMLLADSESGRTVDMKRFYIRRAFRIIPAYLVVLTMLANLSPLTPSQHANLWKEYVYLTNYVPPTVNLVVMTWAWSLALEEHFYLAVPLLMSVLRPMASLRARLWLLGALWLSALLLRAWTYWSDRPWDNDRAVSVLYVQTHLRYDILIAGIATAYIQRYYCARLAEALQSRRVRYALAAPSAIAFALLLGTIGLQHRSVAFKVLCWGTITSIAYMPLVLHLLNYDSVVARLLSRRMFLQIATFGYGIYLVHLPVLHRLVLPLIFGVELRYQWPWPVAWPLSVMTGFVLSLALAYVIHVVIEKPALKLRDIVAR